MLTKLCCENFVYSTDGKKEINKQLTIAQNHLKKMKKQLEESQVFMIV